MTCIVYRKGTGTTEHGIECESTTCEAGEVAALLASGWLPHPPGYEPPETVTPEEIASIAEIPFPFDQTEEIDGLRKELDLRIGIEENLAATVEQQKAQLELARKIEDRLNAELSKLRNPAEAQTEEVDPVRAQGRNAGIEGWETMHLSSLKKALKELEA